MRLRTLLPLGVLALACPNVPARAAEPLTLERIMADPDWIGPPVERPFWSLDGGAVVYSLKRPGSPVRDLWRVAAGGGSPRRVAPAELSTLDAAQPVFDRERRQAAFVRNGDVFVRDLKSRRLTQVTRTPANESSPQFSADGRTLQFRNGNDWFAHDLATGVTGPVALLVLAKDPDEKKPGDLERMQLRLIATLQRDRADRDSLKREAERLRSADATRSPLPVYLGDDVALDRSVISPAGRWLLVVTTAKSYDQGRMGKMPVYVTESGYEETEETRTRVGRNEPAPQTLWLVDLKARTREKLATTPLPGITDDLLASVRAENERAARPTGSGKPVADTARAGTDPPRADSAGAAKKERSLEVSSIVFNLQGTEALLRLTANDNKDRWLATVDFEKHALRPEHRLTDSAWVSWDYNDLGWLPDGKRFWFQSEETGYSHLYTKRPGSPAVALTSGKFEVTSPVRSPDGHWLYALANAEAPYAYDVYRVATAGGAPARGGATGGRLERLTRLQGVSGFGLSPDGARLWVQHSGTHVPTQLAVVSAAGGAARELTDTRSTAYKAIRWPEPRIVAVPSSHGSAPIWSRLYLPADTAGSHPIVMFVHGAGYLQNTQLQFPYYFREQMFHHLLNERGYVVLDMDYRASQGYGRDWRTAIYRRMGEPELEDLIDGVHWLAKEHGGDEKRVGVYGGSYGGFMALMAMFRAPDVFRAGAALRPVTDWAQYNHGYTAAILNTPQVDSLAYARSSPIEYASALKGALLICHGMIDDNVLFEDSVRLYQRLIELHKAGVTLAPFPMERHSFTHADSWLDEYKRIYALFEANLR
jgi:dipeptidyl aminopeptidase/acylaminoacyl peptidase